MMNDGTLLVAVADPTSESLNEVREAVDCPVAFAVTEGDDIRNAWRRLLQGFKPSPAGTSPPRFVPPR